ncbi:MAG: ribonuclease H-like YkuK family protein [Hydrogenibacillus schlegelii]|uniref:Ribonuclease H-like YkuK family protein n=1 Tax=Hydrogenibacillus schlegelii TaxID=1484 RepID=A0A947G9R8_HYDSH|nr:ribonuclease H-like YkuK family protein [Hydrogenibacillus schlegelii]
MIFTSPTDGRLTIAEMLAAIERFIAVDEAGRYKLIIGTDSQTHHGETLFVTAVIVHRIGKGARFFFHRQSRPPVQDLRQRVYLETAASLETVQRMQRDPAFQRIIDLPIEIHVDIGTTGATRSMIQEIVGWVTSVGYTVKIKPQSYGASAVADRYTK